MVWEHCSSWTCNHEADKGQIVGSNKDRIKLFKPPAGVQKNHQTGKGVGSRQIIASQLAIPTKANSSAAGDVRRILAPYRFVDLLILFDRTLLRAVRTRL